LEQYRDTLFYLTKAVEVFDANIEDEYDLSECYFSSWQMQGKSF